MSEAPRYPKRLIELDLPIKRISAHARREKSIRHGHISTLHMWWARRPLAACRAVILSALWPDPADPLCPERFRKEAADRMRAFRDKRGGKQRNWDAPLEVRAALLDFIADFANWDNSNEPDYLETSRALVQVAHEALGGEAGTLPLVVDPFAGGGAIPLEALRVGADVFASDLNPVPVLLNKVVLEHVPKHGQRLANELRDWCQRVLKRADSELAHYYPRDPDGATPIAYLWARTILCEGPGCGGEIPLIKSLWLAKRSSRSIALSLLPHKRHKKIDFEVVVGVSPGNVGEGTVRNGAATCPLCGYTTPNSAVRSQLTARNGGAADARLLAVVVARKGEAGRSYRLPTEQDHVATRSAHAELRSRAEAWTGLVSLLPDEQIPTERPSPNARGLSAVTRMGVRTFGDLYAPRQALILTTLIRLIREIDDETVGDRLLGMAIRTCLALAVDRVAERCCSLARWDSSSKMETVAGTFGRQALPIVWDFAEQVPLQDVAGNWQGAVEWIALVVETLSRANLSPGTVEQASATAHPLPDDHASAFITDPPYYDSVPYADLSDFFYVWLRRSLGDQYPVLLQEPTTPKDEEAIWNPSRVCSRTGKPKDERFYETQMTAAFREGRRLTAPSGIGVVVFAHKSTAGWEAVLSALLEAGWIATASWPIDTEMGTRVNAMGTASLASSVHIVCRPRENSDGSVRTNAIGDWRDVLAELPQRIHDWLPRLADEGIVGADAIFACLGPALQIFSQYSRVEKASGEQVTLKEYLEHVWAAVAKEALNMIFTGADATGFEEDARLTAMWLWTMSAAADGADSSNGSVDTDDDNGDDAPANKGKAAGGFVLEYDAARKIAQGLGAHLENLTSLVEVMGSSARLVPVAERTKSLFGKDDASAPVAKRRKREKRQLSLGFAAELEEAEERGGWGEKGVPAKGETVLSRIHQSMILFAAGRGEALKRFLVDEGVGSDERFWRLAQALSALYPSSTDEKRWVDGVLARKKSVGF